MTEDDLSAPSRRTTDTHQRGHDKVKRIPVKVETTTELLRKPKWIRARAPQGPGITHIRKILRQHQLSSVCEEAQCPNLGECFSHGTATFMIMGDICTRRCPFCDVAHGRPDPLDTNEPENLGRTIRDMGLRYVVITSVDRDDLRDGGAEHFTHCITAIRKYSPDIRVEVLVPDFRGRMDKALDILIKEPPDVFNHNLETVPGLYKKVRPGSDYAWSLNLLKRFKALHPDVTTKSGLMLGVGETIEEVDTKYYSLSISPGNYIIEQGIYKMVFTDIEPDFEQCRCHGKRATGSTSNHSENHNDGQPDSECVGDRFWNRNRCKQHR